MKDRYRLFLRRKSVYYAFDNETKTLESLKTKDKAEAGRLLMTMPPMRCGICWPRRPKCRWRWSPECGERNGGPHSHLRSP